MNTYTTGQIIDAMQRVGQMTFCLDSGNYYKKDFNGGLYRCDEQGQYLYDNNHLQPIKLAGNVADYEWQLLPQYVTFEEAIKAYEHGKKIRVECNDTESIDPEEFKGRPYVNKISFHQIINGKWSIVEEDAE